MFVGPKERFLLNHMTVIKISGKKISTVRGAFQDSEKYILMMQTMCAKYSFELVFIYDKFPVNVDAIRFLS